MSHRWLVAARAHPAAAIVLVAFALRVGVAVLVATLARDAEPPGIWLSDETAYHLAAASLVQPDFLGTALHPGLEHLGGNPYMGLAVSVYALAGSVPLALRVADAFIGAAVVAVTARLAAAVAGRRAALIAGLLAALLPPLVLWSALIIRDGLVALAVVTLGWALIADQRPRGTRLAATLLALYVLAGLRLYAFALALLGIGLWLAYPHWRRRSIRTRLAGAGLTSLAALAAIVLAVGALPGAASGLVQALAYRQAVTRLETQGVLYNAPGIPPEPPPWGLASLVVLRASPPEDRLVGVVKAHLGPAVEEVAFTDGTLRPLAHADLIPFSEASFAPQHVLVNLLPQFASVVTGYAEADEPRAGRVLWVVDALFWDALLLLAVVAVARRLVPARDAVLPLVMAVGTVIVLAAIPGAPGNAARHRASQGTPLLIVLASSLAATRRLTANGEEPGTRATSSNPTTATTPETSRIRSARA